MSTLPKIDCSRARSLSRRSWLRAGGLTGLGLASHVWSAQWGPGLSAFAADEVARPAPGFGRAKSVIVVFANGGQSHIDMWDPKPDAPLEVRGAFDPIATALPGAWFTAPMPRIARVADRLTLVRGMSHDDIDHGSAVYLSLTGTYHAQRSSNPPPRPNDAPTLGAVLRRVGLGVRFAHDAIHLNGPALLPAEPGPGQNGGLLGRAFEPLVVGDVRQAAGTLPGLALHADLPLERIDRRLELLWALEQRSAEQAALDLDESYAQAFQMLASPAARRAFDLSAEPAATRDRYGRNRSGQALLLARRLVEAGVPYINVIWNQSNRGQDDDPDETDRYGWDTHNDIFVSLRERLLPRFDLSFSALIEDLDQRGLLDQTLVVCMGEFGRAPRVAVERNFAGTSPGRKHWANVYSVALAGAGVRRGAIVGASDRLGAEPVGQRYGPWDLAATIFHALGIAPDRHYTDTFDRPFAVSTGRPIEALYA
jgi:hypothetical protein